MSTFSYNVLKDTTEHAVIKLTGVFSDGTQENNSSRITANTLSGALDSSKANLLSSTANTGPLPYYNLSVNRVWYDVSFAGSGAVTLTWAASTPNTIITMSGSGEYNQAGNWTSIPNSTAGAAGSNGNIGLVTTGAASGDAYTVIVELRKDNTQYNRGQFQDPAAFNYGPNYKLRP